MKIMALQKDEEENRPRRAELPGSDLETRLHRLERLWKEGKISNEEYQAARRKALEMPSQ